jgi:hypothetical protein
VQNNKSESLKIAEMTRELMEGIIRSLAGKQEADIDPQLKKDLEDFGR